MTTNPCFYARKVLVSAISWLLKPHQISLWVQAKRAPNPTKSQTRHTSSSPNPFSSRGGEGEQELLMKTNSPLSSPPRKESKNEQFYLPFSRPRGQGHNTTTYLPFSSSGGEGEIEHQMHCSESRSGPADDPNFAKLIAMWGLNVQPDRGCVTLLKIVE